MAIPIFAPLISVKKTMASSPRVTQAGKYALFFSEGYGRHMNLLQRVVLPLLNVSSITEYHVGHQICHQYLLQQ